MKYIYIILVISIMMFTSCSVEDTIDSEGFPHDPTKPIQLTEFIPKTGGMASQVIIKGSNFGTDPEELKVYFNKKKAKVIKTIGDLAYVLTPRLPGDTCVISVVMGDDSVQYKDPFYYQTLVRVSTITGTPEEEATVDGVLAEARFQKPFYIAVDYEKNIIVGEWKARARLVNEEKNSVATLLDVTTSGEMMSGCTDHNGEVIYFPMNGLPYYYEFDPAQQWTPRRINPAIRQEDEGEFDLSGKYSFAVSELDSMLYTITTNGELVKIDPNTRVASLVTKGILKDRIQTTLQAYLTFHPTEKHMLYFVNPSSMLPQDGPIVGTDRIYRINLNTLEVEDFAGTGVKGHYDGPKDLAEFNNPCQIAFDNEGNLYVGDTDNFCVRRISPEGIVSTIAGIPGKSGYLDGDPDIALFDRFWGMVIDDDGTLYIADYYNAAIRKLTVQ